MNCNYDELDIDGVTCRPECAYAEEKICRVTETTGQEPTPTQCVACAIWSLEAIMCELFIETPRSGERPTSSSHRSRTRRS